MYIHQHKNWYEFTWDNNKLISLLAEVRHLQGKLLGQMENLGFSLREEATLNTLTLDILKSTEIEGEILDKEQVRSSIARKLGLEISGLVISSRNVDGVVEMMLDATQSHNKSLSEERLFGWHATLFPTGWSGMSKISVGQYRSRDMQVVSGAIGKEKVHYEAPEAELVNAEMKGFLAWFNHTNSIDSVLKAGISHFWFVTIHPFSDGNGRIARAITDMQLARSDNNTQRFYSMSNQILIERKKYYEILEKSQKGNSNITEWLEWFLLCLKRALNSSEDVLETVFTKADFWEQRQQTHLNDRQRLMLNKLLDGFTGKLTSSKWAIITKTSTDTALRDIQDLVEKGVLQKTPEGGRSTGYELVL